MKLTKADLQRTAVAVVPAEGGHIYRFDGTVKEALQTGAKIVFLLTGHIWDEVLEPTLSWNPKWVRDSLQMDLPEAGSIKWRLETFEAYPAHTNDWGTGPTQFLTAIGNALSIPKGFTWDPARTGPGPSSVFPPSALSHD